MKQGWHFWIMYSIMLSIPIQYTSMRKIIHPPSPVCVVNTLPVCKLHLNYTFKFPSSPRQTLREVRWSLRGGAVVKISHAWPLILMRNTKAIACLQSVFRSFWHLAKHKQRTMTTRLISDPLEQNVLKPIQTSIAGTTLSNRRGKITEMDGVCIASCWPQSWRAGML